MDVETNAAIERHIQLLERHAFEVITAAAREQEAFADDGQAFFALDWIAIRDSIPVTRRRTRNVLRSAGIRNIEAEVLRSVAGAEHRRATFTPGFWTSTAMSSMSNKSTALCTS